MKSLVAFSILIFSLNGFAQTSIPRHDLLDNFSKITHLSPSVGWTLNSYTMSTPNAPYQLISEGPSHHIHLNWNSEGFFILENTTNDDFGENYNIKLTFRHFAGGTIRFDFAGHYSGPSNSQGIDPDNYVSNFIELTTASDCDDWFIDYPYSYGSISVKTREGFDNVLLNSSGAEQTLEFAYPNVRVPCLNFQEALQTNGLIIDDEAEYKLIAYVRGHKATIFIRDANRKQTFKLGKVQHLITDGLVKNMFYIGADPGIQIVNLLLDDLPG